MSIRRKRKLHSLLSKEKATSNLSKNINLTFTLSWCNNGSLYVLSCELDKLLLSHYTWFWREKSITRIIIKFQVHRRTHPACNFIKPESPALVFSCEFCGIFKTSILQNNCKQLFLETYFNKYSTSLGSFEDIKCIRLTYPAIDLKCRY